MPSASGSDNPVSTVASPLEHWFQMLELIVFREIYGGSQMLAPIHATCKSVMCYERFGENWPQMRVESEENMIRRQRSKREDTDGGRGSEWVRNWESYYYYYESYPAFPLPSVHIGCSPLTRLGPLRTLSVLGDRREKKGCERILQGLKLASLWILCNTI